MEFIKFNLIDMPRLEIEGGMPTEASIPLSGRLVEGEPPAGRCVYLKDVGPYDRPIDVTAMLIG